MGTMIGFGFILRLERRLMCGVMALSFCETYIGKFYLRSNPSLLAWASIHPHRYLKKY
jgi:hypothetical protein